MTNTFTLRVNGGPTLRTFEASTFSAFMAEVSLVHKIGSVQALRSFFLDRFQVKILLDTDLLIVRG